MELKKINVKDVTCDFGVCNNPAEYMLTGEGVSTENEWRLCPLCARKISHILALNFKPEKDNGKV